MKNVVLSAALREIRGLWNQLLINLEGEQGDEWLQEFKRFLRKEECWIKAVEAKTETVKKILEFVATTIIGIPVGRFVARDHFKVGTNKKAKDKVKIAWLSDSFKSWFLDKVEEQAGGDSVLRAHKLISASTDVLIIAELGREATAETALAEVFALMKKQSKGEQGSLLVGGYANIFYIRDSVSVLRAVYVYWLDDGWHVYASSVAVSDEWNAGYRVISR